MIKFAFKSELKFSLSEFRKLTGDDQIALKIFEDIKSIDRPDPARKSYVGEEYTVTSTLKGKEYTTKVKILEKDDSSGRSVVLSSNFQGETTSTITISGSEFRTIYEIEYAMTLKGPVRQIFAAFFAKGGLPFMQHRVEKLVNYFDPNAKVEVVKSSVWSAPIEAAYILSCAAIFALFLSVYEYIPKFDISRFSNSKYEESNQARRKVKVVLSFQQEFPDLKEVAKQFSEDDFSLVFSSENEEKFIQSFEKSWDEVVVIDVWLSDIQSSIKDKNKKKALIYAGGRQT